MELPYAGLHQLCAPMLDRLDALPEPQRDALQRRVRPGARRRRPTASWSRWPCWACWPTRPRSGRCSVSSTTPVARRRAPRRCSDSSRAGCSAEPVAIVFAVREPSDEHRLAGLPELALGGSATRMRARCSTRSIPGRLDERVRDRIIAETRGNPLALLELPRGMSAAELAGGFGLPGATRPVRPHRGALPPAARRRCRPTTQRLLLLAAAEPVGDAHAALARRRAARHRAGRRGAGRGRRAARDRRPGPVPPSAGALGRVPRGRRRPSGGRLHRGARRGDRSRRPTPTGARGTAPTRRPARRGRWPPSSSARPPGRRPAGASAAAAAFLERAAALTPDPAERGARALAAAQAKFDAGALDAALALLATAEAGAARRAAARPGRAPARGDRVRTGARRRRPAAAPGRPSASSRSTPAGARDLPRGAAARRSSPAASSAGPPCVEASPRPPARAAGAGATPRRSTCCSTAWRRGSPRATPPARRRSGGRCDAFAREDAAGDLDCAGCGWRMAAAAQDPVGRRAWHISRRGGRVARETGALGSLPLALDYRAGAPRPRGELAAAAALLDGGRRDHAGDRATAALATCALMLAAWRGQEAERCSCRSRLTATRPRAARVGRSTSAEYGTRSSTTASAATTAALAAARAREPTTISGIAHVGARRAGRGGARSGRPDAPRAALERLSERTRRAAPTGRSASRPVARAAEPTATPAEALYREAVERLGRRRIARRTSPAPSSSTANGCAARTAASTRASNCAPPTSCSAAMGAEGSPSAPATSCWPPARRCASARRHARRPHAAGGAHRPAGRRRAHEPGDRRRALHQPAHRRVAPAQGVHEARHHLAQGPPRRDAERGRRRRRRVTARRAPTRVPALRPARSHPGTRATVPPGRTSAQTAAWWPADMTSERASREASVSSEWPEPGTGTSAPSASGTRTASRRHG